MVAAIASSERQMDCFLNRSLANRVGRCPGGAATESTVRQPSAAVRAPRTSSQEHGRHIANQSTVRRRLFKERIVKHTLLASWFGAAVLLSACTGNSVAPTRTRYPPTKLDTYRFTVSGGGWWMQDVVVPYLPAKLSVILTWPDERTNLDLYWTNRHCTIDQNSGTFTGVGCELVEKSTSAGGWSETMYSDSSLYQLRDSRVRLFVHNLTGPSTAALDVIFVDLR
jgi:hypothetical protein